MGDAGNGRRYDGPGGARARLVELALEMVRLELCLTLRVVEAQRVDCHQPAVLLRRRRQLLLLLLRLRLRLRLPLPRRPSRRGGSEGRRRGEVDGGGDGGGER